MAVLIDRRELLLRSRARGLPLAMVEKDYVLGWALYALAQCPELVFKGGTALAKVYFPETWRLSEDLDFVTVSGKLAGIAEEVASTLARAAQASGLEFDIRSRHENPGYVQLKVQYAGVIGRNWLKIDITPESPLAPVHSEPLSQVYSDYPRFVLAVECLEEIVAEKLRALLQRTKVRDYYDVWRLCSLPFDRALAGDLFLAKLAVKGISRRGLAELLSAEAAEALTGYWESELGRLVRPVPEMSVVLAELAAGLSWLPREC